MDRNTCFVAASVHALDFLGLRHHMRNPALGLETELHNTLHGLFDGPRHGNSVDVSQLVVNLNRLLPMNDWIAVGRENCAVEFLEKLISVTALQDNFFFRFYQTALCLSCVQEVRNEGWGFSPFPFVMKIRARRYMSNISLYQEGVVCVNGSDWLTV